MYIVVFKCANGFVFYDRVNSTKEASIIANKYHAIVVDMSMA